MTDQAIPAWAVPGAKVVCIDDNWDRYDPRYTESMPNRPVLKQVLTIHSSVEQYGSIGFRFVEVVNPPAKFYGTFDEGAFVSTHFRPAVEPKSEAHDVALFEDIVRGMSLVERLDRIKESLDS